MEDKKKALKGEVERNLKEHDLDVSKILMPDIGFIIVAIGLSTIAIASGYGSPYILLKVFSLMIYIFAMWAAFIFYWNMLFEKIPGTMEKWWDKKGGRFSLNGPWWIFKRWFRLLVYTGVELQKKQRSKTLECAYLTILLVIFMYWCAGITLYIVGFIEIIDPK